MAEPLSHTLESLATNILRLYNIGSSTNRNVGDGLT
jgi:hypothetical protein